MSTQPTKTSSGPSLYTAIMGVSVVFMLIACICMFVEFNRYAEYGYWQTSKADIR
ncbi:MAG: hypothetical protein AAFP90_06490 [Planctomycetota bacterium]